MESFRVKSAGAELACVRAGSGPPLILAHPVLFSKAFYALDVFSRAFTAVAFDQRGHGETSAATLTPQAAADDVGAVMDAMGWDKAAVGGTSLGAAAALMFALRKPERVSFLVQDLPGFGPGTFRDPSKTGRIAGALEEGDLEEAARRITEGMSAPRAKAWTDSLFSDWKNYDAATLGPKLGWALRATASWRIVAQWPHDLAKLAMPLRILAVQGDPVHPWDVAQAMARTVAGARLVPRVQSLSREAIAEQWLEVLAS